jgi:hypothetical protein
MLHACDEVPGPPPVLTSEGDWLSDHEGEQHGFNMLVEQINRDEEHSFLLDDGADGADGADEEGEEVGSKRSRTDCAPPAKVQRTSKCAVNSCSIDSDAEPPFSTSTLNFVVLYANNERQFIERAKAALGTDNLHYSVREEIATNAFLTARFAMATEAGGTARTSKAVLRADMTPEEKEQATEDALTQEDMDLANFEAGTYFESMLPGRLALAAGLAFS